MLVPAFTFCWPAMRLRLTIGVTPSSRSSYCNPAEVVATSAPEAGRYEYTRFVFQLALWLSAFVSRDTPAGRWFGRTCAREGTAAGAVARTGRPRPPRRTGSGWA